MRHITDVLSNWDIELQCCYSRQLEKYVQLLILALKKLNRRLKYIRISDMQNLDRTSLGIPGEETLNYQSHEINLFL